MRLSKLNPNYKAIEQYYGDAKAERSQVPYIKHIDEGLEIGHILNLDVESMEAYCLHPMFQSDEALRGYIVGSKEWDCVSGRNIHIESIILAMEYRRVANSYLSKDKPEQLVSTPLFQVYEMLKMDKIQNRKDFELHHKGTHPRSQELDVYFKKWLSILDISEDVYEDIVKRLNALPKR